MKKSTIIVSAFIILSTVLLFTVACTDYSEYLEYDMTFIEKEGYDDSSRLTINAGDTREFIISDVYKNSKLDESKLRYVIDNESNEYILTGVNIEGNKLKVDDDALENVISVYVYYKGKLIFKPSSSRTIFINITGNKIKTKQEYIRAKEYIEAKFSNCIAYELNLSYYEKMLEEKDLLEEKKSSISDTSLIKEINVRIVNLENEIIELKEYLDENQKNWLQNKDNYILEKNKALELYYQYHAKPKDGLEDSYGLPS